jgi:hypothetical protein
MQSLCLVAVPYNNAINLTAKPLRGLVPSALRAPAAGYCGRWALLEFTDGR